MKREFIIAAICLLPLLAVLPVLATSACVSKGKYDTTQSQLAETKTATPTLLAQWGSWGRGDGQFDSPAGIAVDGSGNVYVADSGNHRVQKFGRMPSQKIPLRGWLLPIVGEALNRGAASRLSGPFLDMNDNVYVLVLVDATHLFRLIPSENKFTVWKVSHSLNPEEAGIIVDKTAEPWLVFRGSRENWEDFRRRLEEVSIPPAEAVRIVKDIVPSEYEVKSEIVLVESVTRGGGISREDTWNSGRDSKGNTWYFDYDTGGMLFTTDIGNATELEKLCAETGSLERNLAILQDQQERVLQEVRELKNTMTGKIEALEREDDRLNRFLSEGYSEVRWLSDWVSGLRWVLLGALIMALVALVVASLSAVRASKKS